MKTQIRVRTATADDIETIFAIRTGVSENHLSREQLAQMGITAESVGEAIRAEPCAWIAQTAEGKAIGFAMADNQSGSVFAAFVLPQFEGIGAGRLLMQQAENFLFQSHQTLWLETAADSRAAGFYRKLGWRETEKLDGGDARFEKTA